MSARERAAYMAEGYIVALATPRITRRDFGWIATSLRFSR